jgi:pyrroline-5-carboxylate reductase
MGDVREVTQMTIPWPAHLFMVGCGNMAGAMLTRWLASGLDPACVTVLRPSGKAVADGVHVITALPATLPQDATVLLGMKPQQIAAVAIDLAPLLHADTVLISILAGTTLDSLRTHFPRPEAAIRVMPNTPVSVGQGVCALYSDPKTPDTARHAVDGLMQPLGLVEWIDDETQFNLVTALSGCGPAYLFRFIDALASAGQALGLEEGQAARLALATVQGAATLAAQSPDSPGILADRVASPGGMTRKGMDVLDQDTALLSLLTETLRAARDRGIEMAALK